jgi:plastocyanin
VVLYTGPQAFATTRNIVIENIKFNPEEVTIHPGDMIIWTNKDILSHTVTEDKNSFNSGEIKPGASWKKKFRTPGKIFYKCLYHPLMKASLTVAK